MNGRGGLLVPHLNTSLYTLFGCFIYEGVNESVGKGNKLIKIMVILDHDKRITLPAYTDLLLN